MWGGGPDSVRLWFLLLAWGGNMGLGHLGVGFLGGFGAGAAALAWMGYW